MHLPRQAMLLPPSLPPSHRSCGGRPRSCKARDQRTGGLQAVPRQHSPLSPLAAGMHHWCSSDQSRCVPACCTALELVTAPTGVADAARWPASRLPLAAGCPCPSADPLLSQYRCCPMLLLRHRSTGCCLCYRTRLLVQLVLDLGASRDLDDCSRGNPLIHYSLGWLLMSARSVLGRQRRRRRQGQRRGGRSGGSRLRRTDLRSACSVSHRRPPSRAKDGSRGCVAQGRRWRVGGWDSRRCARLRQATDWRCDPAAPPEGQVGWRWRHRQLSAPQTPMRTPDSANSPELGSTR